MIFPHEMPSFLLNVNYLQTDNLKPAPAQTSSSFDHTSSQLFFPCFQPYDEVLQALNEAGICDLSGQTTLIFGEEFSLEYSQFSQMFEKIEKFLTKVHLVDSTIVQDKKINISINYYTLLKNLIQIGFEKNLQYDGQEWFPPQLIEDIRIYGSGVFEFLISEIICHVAQTLLSKTPVLQEKIPAWFKLPHVRQHFEKCPHDVDLCVLNQGNLRYQKYLSNKTLKFLTDSILKFDSSFFLKQLKLKDSQRYESLTEKNTFQGHNCKEWSVLEYGGLKTYKVIPDKQHVIFGIKVVEDLPIDISFFGNHAQHNLGPHNLSSQHSWAVSILSIINEPNNKKNWTLKISCKPFNIVKAIIDILCHIYTFADPSISAWQRYLRDCVRSMQEGIESKMVKQVLSQKQQFLNEFNPCKSSLSPFLTFSQLNQGQYIALLLEEEIKKSQLDEKTKKVSPTKVTAFLFRACISLQQHSRDFSDEDCLSMWLLANKIGWLQFEVTEKRVENDALESIKHAIIEEKVPFSVLSAWIGILAWIYAPRQATPHCQQPTFHLTKPVLSLLPIHPIEDGKVLQNYFKKNSCPASFVILHQVIASMHQTSLVAFPLIPHLAKLNVDPLELKKLADDWLTHHVSVLNVIGVQMYLAIGSLFPQQDNLKQIFYLLPRVVKELKNNQQIQEIVKALKLLAEKLSKNYHEVLQQIDFQDETCLESPQWIALLCNSRDHELVLLSYHLWKREAETSVSFVRKHQNLHLSLFKALCLSHPHYALYLLQRLQRLRIVHTRQNNFSDLLSTLIKSYNKFAPIQFVCDLDAILGLIIEHLEKRAALPQENKQKEEFLSALMTVIDGLHSNERHQVSGDDLLLQICRGGYVGKTTRHTEQWLKRLVTLATQPQHLHYTYFLYRIVCLENLVDLAQRETPQWQQLSKTIGKALFNPNQDAQYVQNQIFSRDAQNEPLSDFYEELVDFFRNQYHAFLANSDLRLFDLLLMATRPQTEQQSQSEILRFLQTLTDFLTKTSSTQSHELENVPLSFFDQFLNKKTIVSLMDKDVGSWKKALIDYLECSLEFRPQERMKLLWQVYEKLLRLYHKQTATTEENLRLYKLLSRLLNDRSASPTPKIQEWLKGKYESIIKKLYESHLIEEAKTILFALKPHQIEHLPLAKQVWLIGRKKELQSQSFPSVLQLIDLDTFENLSATVQVEDYRNIHAVIFTLISSLQRHHDAWKWINWCLAHPDKDKMIPHWHLMNLCLKCAEGYIAESHYLGALEILVKLSNLTQNQQQEACEKWLKVMQKLYSSTTVKMTRQLFLNGQVTYLDTGTKGQFKEYVEKVIERYMSNPLQKGDDQRLLLDLLKEYNIIVARYWLFLWKTLNEKEEINFVQSVWSGFISQSSHLFGTDEEIAECWTEAFIHLKNVEDEALLFYFENLEWLKFFSSQTTNRFKWRALEAVILRTIKTLSHSRFDAKLYHLILEKIHKLTEQKERYDQSETSAKWCSQIDLALIEQLHESSDIACLTCVCKLFQTVLRQNGDEVHFQKCLPYLEKIFHTFIILETFTKDSVYQDLFVEINATVEILCEQKTACHHFEKFVSIFVINATPTHIEIAIKFAAVIFKRKNLSQIDALKAPFMTLLSAIESVPTQLSSIEKQLASAFKLMQLTLVEKGELSHRFIVASWKLSESHYKESDYQKFTTDVLALYTKWGKFLFSDANRLKGVLEAQMIPVIVPYSAEGNELQNQERFTSYVRQICDVWLEAKSMALPTYRVCLENYYSWLFKMLKDSKAKQEYLLRALKDYIQKFMDLPLSSHRSSDILSLVRLYVHLYPPEMPTWIEVQTSKGLIKGFRDTYHMHFSKQLVKMASEKKLFTNNSDEEIELKLHLHIELAKSDLQRSYRPLFERTIERLLQLNTSYCIFRAIMICSEIQATLLTSKEYPTLIPLYKKILDVIKPFATCSVQNDEVTHNSLFGYLEIGTLCKLKDDTQPNRQNICKVAQLYFDFCFGMLKSLKLPLYQAHYLSSCFRILKIQAENGGFENNISSYLSILRALFPWARKLELESSYCTPESNLVIPPETNFIKEWINVLLYSLKPLNPKEQKSQERQQRQVLLEHLQYLQQKENGENLTQICDHILTALVTVWNPQKPNFTRWMNANQPDAVKLFESLKQNFTVNSEIYLKIAIELLNAKFYFDAMQINYSEQLKHAYKILEYLSPLSESNLLCSNLSDTLLEIFFLAPNKDPEVYFEQREKLTLNLISTFKIIFEKEDVAEPKEKQELFQEKQEFLIRMLEMAIDQNLLRACNPEAIEKLEWSKKYCESQQALQFRLTLVDLIFYTDFYIKTDYETFNKRIYSLIDPLSEFVVVQKELTHSHRFARLICTIPTPGDKLTVLVDYLTTFPKLKINEQDKSWIFQHLREISEMVKKDENLKGVQVILENSNSVGDDIMTTTAIQKMIKMVLHQSK